MRPSGPKRPLKPSGTAALASGTASAPPLNSLETRAGFVLLASTERLAVAHPFDAATVTIGRAEDQTLRLWDVASSQRHARVDFEGGAWVLRDLRSSNGTYVEGRRVQHAVLESSAVVRIGDNVFKFVRAAIESYAHYDVDGVLRGRPFEDETDAQPLGALVGGYRMHRLARKLRRLATGNVTVGIAGEPGTEKERCARQLHAWSQRPGGFVAMTAAGSDARTLAWSIAQRLGEMNGGTLFLDDADALGPADVSALERMLAAAHASLALGLGPGRGASDSDPYVVPISPLRERKEDLRGLCRAALHAMGHGALEVDYGFLLGLAHYDFPGNVEELERILKSAVASCTGPFLGKDDLPRGLRARMARAFRQGS